MINVLAVVALAGLFVAFGLSQRRRTQDGCGTCPGPGQAGGCGMCDTVQETAESNHATR